MSNLNNFPLTWSCGSRQRSATSTGWKFQLNNLAVTGVNIISESISWSLEYRVKNTFKSRYLRCWPDAYLRLCQLLPWEFVFCGWPGLAGDQCCFLFVSQFCPGSPSVTSTEHLKRLGVGRHLLPVSKKSSSCKPAIRTPCRRPDPYPAVYRQKAATAYLENKQLLLFGFPQQYPRQSVLFIRRVRSRDTMRRLFTAVNRSRFLCADL